MSRDVLRRTEAFFEDLVAGKKEGSSSAVTAARRMGRYREEMEAAGGGRAGPIWSRGTGLSTAMETTEEYYVGVAEGTMERWRAACLERPAPQEPESIKL